MPDTTDPTRTDEHTLASAFDPQQLSAAFYADPYPTYRALQAHDPLHRLADGSRFLTRYADLDAVYRDRARYSSDKRAAFAPTFGVDSPLYAHHTTSLVFNDPPYHTRVRRHIVAALSPATLKRMATDLDRLVARLCADLCARRDVDLIADYAAALPVEVIGNLLAVPADERGALRDWSLSILAALDPAPDPATIARGNRAVVEFLDFTAILIADRRRRPLGAEDLISRLLAEETAAEPLSEAELQHNCIFLLNAGHETTTNLIGNALKLILDTPGAAARLRAEPGLVAGAIEECLRLESPNQLGNRLVTAPVTLGGLDIPAGTYLTLCIGAANRDPRAFEDPDRFDLTRQPGRHLAFAAGAHACAGMNVARLEAQVAITGFIARCPGARLTGPGLRNRRARFRGFQQLPAQVG